MFFSFMNLLPTI